MAPWEKEMKKIAVEEHYLSNILLTHLKSRKEWPKIEIFEDGGKKVEKLFWAPGHYFVHHEDFPLIRRILDVGEARIEEMDRNGITMQVLSLSIPGVELLDPEQGTAIAREINNELFETIKQYPERFSGFAAIAPQDPGSAANELERAVKELGFKGAMINSHIRGEYLDNPKFRVILEKAQALGVPLYLHPKQPAPEMIQPFLDYPPLANAMWGFGAETGLHAMRLICSGVFDRFPDLKVILGHLGEALPFWMWRIDNHWDKDASKYLPAQEKPSHYLKNNFFVTTSGMFWPAALDFVKSELGVDKILFAVDYPFEDNEEAIRFMDAASLTSREREKIYSLNATKLLNL